MDISLLDDRALCKGAWVVALLGTHLRIQDHKNVKFSGQDISSLAVKGLKIIHDLKTKTFLKYFKTV